MSNGVGRNRGGHLVPTVGWPSDQGWTFGAYAWMAATPKTVCGHLVMSILVIRVGVALPMLIKLCGSKEALSVDVTSQEFFLYKASQCS